MSPGSPHLHDASAFYFFSQKMILKGERFLASKYGTLLASVKHKQASDYCMEVLTKLWLNRSSQKEPIRNMEAYFIASLSNHAMAESRLLEKDNKLIYELRKQKMTHLEPHSRNPYLPYMAAALTALGKRSPKCPDLLLDRFSFDKKEVKHTELAKDYGLGSASSVSVAINRCKKILGEILTQMVVS